MIIFKQSRDKANCDTNKSFKHSFKMSFKHSCIYVVQAETKGKKKQDRIMYQQILRKYSDK